MEWYLNPLLDYEETSDLLGEMERCLDGLEAFSERYETSMGCYHREIGDPIQDRTYFGEAPDPIEIGIMNSKAADALFMLDIFRKQIQGSEPYINFLRRNEEAPPGHEENWRRLPSGHRHIDYGIREKDLEQKSARLLERCDDIFWDINGFAEITEVHDQWFDKDMRGYTEGIEFEKPRWPIDNLDAPV